MLLGDHGIAVSYEAAAQIIVALGGIVVHKGAALDGDGAGVVVLLVQHIVEAVPVVVGIEEAALNDDVAAVALHDGVARAAGIAAHGEGAALNGHGGAVHGIDADVIAAIAAVIIAAGDGDVGVTSAGLYGDVIGVQRHDTVAEGVGTFGEFLRTLIGSVLVVLVVEAVVLHSVLRGVDSDGNAADGQIHVLVAGGLLHVALDGEGIALAGLQMLLGTHSHIADGPLDGLVQLGIPLDAGDLDHVLQSQIAVVDDTQLRQGIGAARLPQDGFVFSASGLDEVQRLALGGNPLASGILHFQRHIQLTGLNFVDAGACGVGEPCEGSAYQHSQAQNHGHDAAQQGPFGTLAVCHSIFLLIFLRVGQWGAARRMRTLTSGLRPSSEWHAL